MAATRLVRIKRALFAILAGATLATVVLWILSWASEYPDWYASGQGWATAWETREGTAIVAASRGKATIGYQSFSGNVVAPVTEHKELLGVTVEQRSESVWVGTSMLRPLDVEETTLYTTEVSGPLWYPLIVFGGYPMFVVYRRTRRRRSRSEYGAQQPDSSGSGPDPME